MASMSLTYSCSSSAMRIGYGKSNGAPFLLHALWGDGHPAMLIQCSCSSLASEYAQHYTPSDTADTLTEHLLSLLRSTRLMWLMANRTPDPNEQMRLNIVLNFLAVVPTAFVNYCRRARACFLMISIVQLMRFAKVDTCLTIVHWRAVHRAGFVALTKNIRFILPIYWSTGELDFLSLLFSF